VIKMEKNLNKENWVILNGKFIRESEAKISILDKAYFFDFAVYSTLKVIKGKIFFPEFHVKRLFESARLIDLGHNFNEQEVLKWLDLLIKKNNIKDGLLRMVLIGDVEENKNARLYIFSFPGVVYYPNKFYKKGVKVITYFGERFLPQSKSKNLLLNFLAFREAQKKGALDALLVDRERNIREGTRSNFFAIKGDNLITPPKEKVLEGITRKIVLEVSKEHFKIKEKDISLDDLEKYDEFFITSTSMGVMPVSQIDDMKIETTFEKTKIILKLYKEYYHKNVLGD